MQKKNILLITLRADIGGGPEHVYQLIKNCEENINIFIACPKEKPYYERFLEVIPKENLLILPHRKFKITAFISLVYFIKNKKILIVHSHGKGAGIYARLAGLFTKTKVAHTFHGLHLEYKPIFNYLYCLLEGFLSKYLTNLCISVSESEKSSLLAKNIALQRNLRVIENGVYVPTDQYIKPLSQPINILHVTRMNSHKNTELLIPIALELIKLGIEFKVFVIGNGPNFKKINDLVLEENLKEKIIFLGVKTNIIEDLKKAHLLISTSLHEGLPFVILEAMAMGVPCIASDVVGNQDLVKEEFGGLLYPLDKPAQAALQIQKIVSSEKLYQKFSKLAYQRAKENYDVKKMAFKTWNALISL